MGIAAVQVPEIEPPVWAILVADTYFRLHGVVIGWPTEELATTAIPDAILALLDNPEGHA